MNSKRKNSKRFVNQFNFEEIDHRLSCGWHAETSGIALRKKYLREIKHTSQNALGSNTTSN